MDSERQNQKVHGDQTGKFSFKALPLPPLTVTSSFSWEVLLWDWFELTNGE